MIKNIKSNTIGSERAKEIRQLKKDGWISSVEISRMERFRKIKPNDMIKLCKDSKEFNCLKIDVHNSIKYWYKHEQLDAILKVLGYEEEKSSFDLAEEIFKEDEVRKE
jgi:hypothetical protein